MPWEQDLAEIEPNGPINKRIERTRTVVLVSVATLIGALCAGALVIGGLTLSNQDSIKSLQEANKKALSLAVTATYRSALFSCEQTNERNSAAVTTTYGVAKTREEAASKIKIINQIVPVRECILYAYDREHGIKYNER